MIKIMFDNTKYSNKPNINEVKKLQNRLQQTEIEINDLANNLAQGCTFKPAYLNGRTSNDFVSQQLFALDFDNNSDIETELNRCKELNIIPCFGYTTFSHTEEHHKFRLVFCNDEVITDKNERDKLQNSLILAFDNCDKQTIDASRLFFGGKELIYKNYNSSIKGSDIVAKFYKNNNTHNIINVTSKPLLINDEYYNDNIEAIKNLDSNKLNILLFGEKVSGYTNNNDLSTYQKPPTVYTKPIDLYNYLDTIDLYEFLNVEGKSFNCILHNDNNPSAGIQIKDNGHYVYHCFGCGFKGGIVHIVEKLSGKSRYHAIKFLKEVYNLDLFTEWQKENRAILDENISYVLSGKMEEEYPDLWKYIKPRQNDLVVLLTYAKDNVVDDSYEIDGLPIFYGSLSYLFDKFECKSSATANNTIQLFCLLDMCRKVSPDKLPLEMQKKHEMYKHLNEVKKQINTYQIPSYSINILDDSNKNALTLKENNFTIKGLSREYVVRTFDESLADKVYPQDKGKKISKKANEKSAIISDIINGYLILNSYITEKEIIERFQSIKYLSEDKIKTQIKRSIQEILDAYDLIRVRANKQLKEYFGISSNGYPFLILKNEDYIKFIEGCEK